MTSHAARVPPHSVRLRLLALGLFLPGLLAPPASAQSSGYLDAVAQVPHRHVSLHLELKAAISTVKNRFPTAALAACAPTGSMAPTLDANYLAVLEDRPFGRLRRGDIILTTLGSGARYAAVMHRVVDTAGLGNLQTRGDALPNPDPGYTTCSTYLGKRVVAAIHVRTGEIRWLFDAKSPPPTRAPGPKQSVLARRTDLESHPPHPGNFPPPGEVSRPDWRPARPASAPQ